MPKIECVHQQYKSMKAQFLISTFRERLPYYKQSFSPFKIPQIHQHSAKASAFSKFMHRNMCIVAQLYGVCPSSNFERSLKSIRSARGIIIALLFSDRVAIFRFLMNLSYFDIAAKKRKKRKIILYPLISIGYK